MTRTWTDCHCGRPLAIEHVCSEWREVATWRDWAGVITALVVVIVVLGVLGAAQ